VSSAREVIDFWFGEHARSRWFAKETAFDDEIRARFEADTLAAAAREREAWLADADGALALVILLDQFPRNMYRGMARAFSCDARAHEVAARAIENGLDTAVAVERRLFFYLPFQHSESLADQDRSVELFTRWVAQHEPANRAEAEDELKYVHRHREIIARFGRFPHRNAALGRTCTAEETAFLAGPESSF
jgi:uncharacterized protein (DUF924 family)